MWRSFGSFPANFLLVFGHFCIRADVKKVTSRAEPSRAEPSWKYFSSSYGSSQLGSDSLLEFAHDFAIIGFAKQAVCCLIVIKIGEQW